VLIRDEDKVALSNEAHAVLKALHEVSGALLPPRARAVTHLPRILASNTAIVRALIGRPGVAVGVGHQITQLSLPRPEIAPLRDAIADRPQAVPRLSSCSRVPLVRGELKIGASIDVRKFNGGKKAGQAAFLESTSITSCAGPKPAANKKAFDFVGGYAASRAARDKCFCFHPMDRRIQN
jgi:hypothetical protein